MAAITTLQICHFPSSTTKSKFHKPSFFLLPFPPRAAADPNPNPPETPNEDESQTSAGGDSDDANASFESRLSQIRIKYRSGTGKKAEQRRARKSPATGSSGRKGGKNGGAGVMLPPVPLREPVTAEGIKVELGFSPYSERINGRMAALGLAALVLVEIGSGKGLLSYHAPPMLFIQIYTVAAAAAVFVKYEKERVSVWPQNPPPSVDDQTA